MSSAPPSCPQCLECLPELDVTPRAHASGAALACPNCSWVFIPSEDASRPRLARPEGVDVRELVLPATPAASYRAAASGSQRALEITVRWFLPYAPAGFLACVALFGGSIFVSAQESTLAGAATMVCAVSLVGAYAWLALTVNRTRIVVSERDVKVSHAPLPWGPSPTFALERVRRLSVVRRGRAVDVDGALRWALQADVDGAAIDLVRSLPSPSIPSYLRQVIETRLAETRGHPADG